MLPTIQKLRLKIVWFLFVPFLYFVDPSAKLLVIGILFGLVGLMIRAWAAGLVSKNKELAIQGPYAYTRNPLYIGSIFLCIGVTMVGGQWFFMILILIFYLSLYHIIARREEIELEKIFGEEYRAYARVVPFFIPSCSPYVKTGAIDRKFSMAQYIRNREWEVSLGSVIGYGFLVLKFLLLS